MSYKNKECQYEDLGAQQNFAAQFYESFQVKCKASSSTIQGKTVLLNSVQVQLIETEAWLLLFFFMFTQSMFWVQKLEKVDSSSRLKMNGCSFQQVLRQNLSCFLSENRKMIFLSFILNPTERAQVYLKYDSRDFQNYSPFERSAYFYVTIPGNFVCFQYFDFETNFKKNENLFQKTGVTFFQLKVLRLKAHYFYTNCPVRSQC